MGDDRLWGVNRREKGAGNTSAAPQSIRAARPDGAPFYVILDIPSVHKGTDIRRWAKKHEAEAHFGPLRQFTIANSHHFHHTVQTQALLSDLRWRSANTRHRDVPATLSHHAPPLS